MTANLAYKRTLAVPLHIAERLEDLQWQGSKYRTLADVVREIAAIGLDALEAEEKAEEARPPK